MISILSRIDISLSFVTIEEEGDSSLQNRSFYEPMVEN
jgi:hypothetical protein